MYKIVHLFRCFRIKTASSVSSLLNFAKQRSVIYIEAIGKIYGFLSRFCFTEVMCNLLVINQL